MGNDLIIYGGRETWWEQFQKLFLMVCIQPSQSFSYGCIRVEVLGQKVALVLNLWSSHMSTECNMATANRWSEEVYTAVVRWHSCPSHAWRLVIQRYLFLASKLTRQKGMVWEKLRIAGSQTVSRAWHLWQKKTKHWRVSEYNQVIYYRNGMHPPARAQFYNTQGFPPDG